MRWRLVGVLAGSFALGAAAAAVLFLPDLWREIGVRAKTVTVGRALVGGPFALTDHNGRRVTEKDFAGRYMLVYFGFTHCPDVCPASLQVMAAALDRLGPKAERVTPVLVTVDPERDTPAQLKTYVGQFHPRLVGLTGSEEEVRVAAKAFRVYYNRVKDERSTAAYTMDHSSIFLLMDPAGEFVTHFVHGTSVDAMAGRLRELVR